MKSSLSSSPKSPSRLNGHNAGSSFPTTIDEFSKNDERNHTPGTLTPQNSSEKREEQEQQHADSGDADISDVSSSISFGKVFVFWSLLSH